MENKDLVFEQLYGECKKYPIHMAYKILRKSKLHLIEELAADFWVHFYEVIDKYEGKNGAKLKTFFHSVCRNFILNFSRNECKSKEIQMDREIIELAFSNINSNTPSQLNEVIKKETVENVRKCISRMPKKHRDIANTYYIDELSEEDTLKKLNITRYRFYKTLPIIKKFLVDNLPK